MGSLWEQTCSMCPHDQAGRIRCLPRRTPFRSLQAITISRLTAQRSRTLTAQCKGMMPATSHGCDLLVVREMDWSNSTTAAVTELTVLVVSPGEQPAVLCDVAVSVIKRPMQNETRHNAPGSGCIRSTAPQRPCLSGKSPPKDWNGCCCRPGPAVAVGCVPKRTACCWLGQQWYLQQRSHSSWEPCPRCADIPSGTTAPRYSPSWGCRYLAFGLALCSLLFSRCISVGYLQEA